MLDPVSKRIVHKSRSYRALRPIEPKEARLFSILLDGTFVLQGFHNHHIRRRLYPGSERNPTNRRKSAGRVTRLLRLLRAHGLIRKVSKTFYYRVTARGNQIMATISNGEVIGEFEPPKQAESMRDTHARGLGIAILSM